MIDIISIAGCPALTSGANAILGYAQSCLTRTGLQVETVNVRHLPADELWLGQRQSSLMQRSQSLMQQASGLLIATSIQKFGYPGVLKAFLDLLPNDAFVGKQVLLFATAPTLAQFRSCERSLCGILTGLGVNEVLDAVYLPIHGIRLHDRRIWLESELNRRVDLAIHHFAARLLGTTPQCAPLTKLAPSYTFSPLQSCS